MMNNFQFNMMQRNQMNNFNNFYINNNFYNNNNLNNPYFNNMMMYQTMLNQNLIQQNIMMQNMIRNNNIYLNQQNLKNQMEQILNNSGLNNEINNNNEQINQETEEERKEREESEKMSLAISDVVKEQLTQMQNFEQLQPPQNLNYDEVDPEFINSFISDKELFCGRGHNLIGKWAHGENRGGRPYNPPDGWIGFGLNVINKYDNGNNDWLACDGRPGEWCVAFHGACVRSTSDQIKQIIKPILQYNSNLELGKLVQDIMMLVILDKKLEEVFIVLPIQQMLKDMLEKLMLMDIDIKWLLC